MRALYLLVIASVALISCAKDRGVDPLRYQTTEMWQPKSQYYGDRSDMRTPFYAKVTVVKNTNDGGFAAVGYQTDMRVGYFNFTRDSLQFISTQGAYRGRVGATMNEAPIIYSWPVTHHQAQLQENDGKTTNKEIDDDKLSWDKKNFFKPDFAKPDVTEDNTFLRGESECWPVKSRRLVDNSIQLEKGYVSFVIEVLYDRNCYGSDSAYMNGHTTYAVQYRYSFREVVESDYKPLMYAGEQDPRMRKFGYFQSTKEELVKGEKKNLFFVNRWNPNKSHHFYFTKVFPAKYKSIYYDIFEKTNKVFSDKGLKVRFYLHENDYDPETGKQTGKPKEFGDLRYSFINLIEEYDPAAPLGYGPSDADPYTGEIVAANLNVWSAMLEMYLRRIEVSYFRNGTEPELAQKSKWDNSTLYSEMKNLLEEEDPTKWVPGWSSPGMESMFNKMANYTVYTYPGWNAFTGMGTKVPVTPFYDKATPQGFQEKEFTLSAKEMVDLNVGQTIVDYILNTQFPQTETVTLDMRLINYRPLENSAMLKAMPQAMQKINLDSLKELTSGMEQYEKQEMKYVHDNVSGHCRMSMESSLVGVERYMLFGFTTDEIAEAIIYNTSIHELGHNLNLRHNFYGSVDKANFSPASVPKYWTEFVKDADGNIKLDESNRPMVTGNKIPVIGADGNQELWPSTSSSVMDYMRLQDEFFSQRDWEPYDKAALLYAYSDGKMDDGKLYLYCSDEHTLASAICNRFDRGTTPSEIAMSFIDTYEEGYFIRNYRFERQYWNTSGYMSGIISLMREIKEFLPMWRAAFYETNIRELLKKEKITDKIAGDEIIENMDREMKQAVKLSMAFYQAVLAQKNTDKPYRSVYELGTGALQRMGIGSDKMVAMYFLAGDDELFYNPNRVLLYSSYLTYMNEPEFAPMMYKLMENVVTQRVDMEPWFISFGRQLYAQSAMNYSNRDNVDFIKKIKIKKFTIEELGEYFNYQIDSSSGKISNLVTLTQSKDLDFDIGEEVAVVRVNTSYYMFSKQDSEYAFDIYKGIKSAEENDSSTVEGQQDLLELYYIYSLSTGTGGII